MRLFDFYLSLFSQQSESDEDQKYLFDYSIYGSNWMPVTLIKTTFL